MDRGSTGQLEGKGLLDRTRYEVKPVNRFTCNGHKRQYLSVLNATGSSLPKFTMVSTSYHGYMTMVPQAIL